jgi:predicted transcriptional regulator
MEQEFTYKIAENMRQWESRKVELRNEEQRHQRLEVEAMDSRVELEHLRPKRLELDVVIAEKQALLDAVNHEKHSVSEVLQRWSEKHREYTTTARLHERVRTEMEEFFRRQRLAERAAEWAAREAREAREAEERSNKQPIQILLNMTRSLFANIRTVFFGSPQEGRTVEVESNYPSSPGFISFANAIPRSVRQGR